MSTPTTPRVTYAKAKTDGDQATYTVLLDGEPVGAVTKVREHYLRRLGGHRGNNVPAARTAWLIRDDRARIHHDTRAEAAVALLADTRGMSYGDALDLVRSKA